MILLDTNVISEPLRPRPDLSVVTWLDAQEHRTLYLSTITVAEIRFGIAILPHGKRRDTLESRFETEVLSRFVERVLPFDESATRSYATLRSAARRRGDVIGDFDTIIAAIAHSTGMTVATRDTAPFTVAGLHVINPFTE